MSKYTERATLALHKMIREMFRKNIEISRISKCSCQLLSTGISKNSIPDDIIEKLIESQYDDGGFVAIPDTLWNCKLLEFYPEYEIQRKSAIKWLNDQSHDNGFGRGKRDMIRIPVSGIAYYLLPELASDIRLNQLEKLWCSEKKSLVYKAGYTLMAFYKNDYQPREEGLIEETVNWISSQQEDNGGFAPWKNHPVGTNVYCTSISLLGLLCYAEYVNKEVFEKGYNYIIETQLRNGIWPYHEIEDGAAWGLRALTELERSLL